jgi:hypothetical protein
MLPLTAQRNWEFSMRTSVTNSATAANSLERMITTDMSANVVAGLLKRGWSSKKIAQTIEAPTYFIDGVRAKKHVLTWRDLTRIARATRTSPELVFVNAIDVRAGMKPLFDSLRETLELAAAPLRTYRQQRRNGRPRKAQTKAA